MNAVLEQIQKIGIVPVVKIDRVEDAVPLAKALCAGGLPCAEVTFRTGAAAAAIKAMTEDFPQMCVGAGTVLNYSIYKNPKNDDPTSGELLEKALGEKFDPTVFADYLEAKFSELYDL